ERGDRDGPGELLERRGEVLLGLDAELLVAGVYVGPEDLAGEDQAGVLVDVATHAEELVDALAEVPFFDLLGELAIAHRVPPGLVSRLGSHSLAMTYYRHTE